MDKLESLLPFEQLQKQIRKKCYAIKNWLFYYYVKFEVSMKPQKMIIDFCANALVA
jgi:hypothetical protein